MAETDGIDLEKLERDFSDPERQLIRQVGDVTIIGVQHHVDTTKQKRPYQPFTDIIDASDHLLLESSVKNPIELHRPASFEEVAEIRFTTSDKAENIHSLDEGYNKIDLFEQYGLDSRVVLLDYILGVINPHAKGGQVSMDTCLQEMPRIVDSAIENFVSEEKKGTIDKTALTILAQEYTKVLFNPDDQSQKAQLIRSSMDGRTTIKLYTRDIRDYEKIGPNLLSLLPRLEGKKTVMVGKAHVPNIENILRGKGIPKPNSWQAFLRGTHPHLDQARIEAAKLFTKIATGKEKIFNLGQSKFRLHFSRKGN